MTNFPRTREVLVLQYIGRGEKKKKRKGKTKEKDEVSAKQNQFVTLSAFINTSVHVDRGIGARDQNGLI